MLIGCNHRREKKKKEKKKNVGLQSVGSFICVAQVGLDADEMPSSDDVPLFELIS